MKSIVLKSGIIAVILILSHCVNEPPSTIHPLLSFTEERVNDTSRVIITTTGAEDFSLYRVVDSVCTLQVAYHAIIGGMADVVDSSYAIANDSAAFEAGRFDGIWVPPDSLYLSIGIIPIDTINIYGCVTDETGHEACASLMLVRDTTLPEIRYQTY